MAAVKHLCGIVALALVVSHAGAQAHLPAVRRVVVVSQNPLQLQIQTSPSAAPQTQMISGPDRLVIDIPNTAPAATLRGISVNRGEVKGVRTSLFSTAPSVTRIVVDLKSPQPYHVVPNARGLLVTVGDDSESAANAPAAPAPAAHVSAIGWVSPNAGARVVNVSGTVSARKKLPHPTLPANSVSVQFTNGLLSIQATGATLSEVLFQIQKQTGAEIAIPSGTEQDRVASNFGPGPASEVLRELLNGSGLNFVIVGSESDPTALHSVILTQKPESSAEPVAVPQPNIPDGAQNPPPDTPEMVAPPDDDPAQPQVVQPPADGSAPVPLPPPSQ
jgi:hypothetical protein